MSELQKHLCWYHRPKRRRAQDEELLCVACGCGGNQECKHEPLMAPDHHCELDINDQGRCYCCRKAGLGKP
jgi:hypothetical protein